MSVCLSVCLSVCMYVCMFMDLNSFLVYIEANLDLKSLVNNPYISYDTASSGSSCLLLELAIQ